MAYYAGIEIDGMQVRATVVEGSPKKVRVVDFIEGQLQGETDEERAHSLRELLGDALLGKDRVGLDTGLSLGADRAILREISVPYSKDEMIAKTIRYESESYIFSHSIDDLIIEYLKCNDTEAGSRLILCAVEKRHIQEELDRLKTVEIDPVHVELNATALAHAYQHAEPASDEENTLLVQIEREHTTFVLLEKGKITKVRSVWNVMHGLGDDLPDSPMLLDPDWEVGGTDPEAAIDEVESAIEDRFKEIERSLGGIEGDGDSPARPTELPSEPAVASAPTTPILGGDEPMFAVVSDEEFERFQESGGGVSDAPASGDPAAEAAGEGTATGLALAPIGDPFDRIVVELERTFAGYLLGGSIDRLVVTGAEAAAIDAPRRLSEQFEVEALGVPLERLESGLSGTNHEAFLNGGAVSLGLALRTAGIVESSFELRRDEFRFERRFERLMPSLTLVSLMLAALSLIWMVDTHRKATTLKQENEVIRGRGLQVFEQFFGRGPAGGPNTKNIAQAAKDELKRLSGQRGGRRQAKLKQYAGAMEFLEDFYTAVQSTRPPIYPVYQEFDFNPLKKERTKSTVKINLPTVEASAAFADNFRAKSKFFDVYPSPSETKEGTYDVTLELQYKLSE